ncbi:extracellular solute-binding protein [Actinomadura kijaniata]|uniref:extracellular solute-binding protein n=1 Tax=Actinomadura kijaniata TaxID=46161 RepID=UPI00082B53F0|nr:extracellular solute-binding protein [Actinomadura kijaniata]
MTGHDPRRPRRRPDRRLCAAVGAVLMLVAAGVVIYYPRYSYEELPGRCDRNTLVVAGGTDVSLNNQRRALIRRWNADHPRTPAVLQEIDPSTDLQHSQLKAVGDSASCAYDVLILDNPRTAEFAENDRLLPLEPPPDAGDFFPAALRTGRHGGVQYALPFNLDVGLLYHRRDRPPPATWADLYRTGFTTQLRGDYEGLTVNALEAVWNDGAADRLTGGDRPDRRRLRDQVFPALLRLSGRVAASEPLRRSRGFDEQASIAAFASGDVPMRNWPYAYPTLATEPRMREGGRLTYSVTALPGRTVLGGQNLAVSARSPHPGEATRLVHFLTSRDSQRLLFSCGGFAPVRHSALGLQPGRDDPAAVAVPPCSRLPGTTAVRGEPDIPDRAQLAELGRAVLGSLARAQPRPHTPHYTTFTETFRGCVNAIMRGRGDADRFATAVAESLDGRAASC